MAAEGSVVDVQRKSATHEHAEPRTPPKSRRLDYAYSERGRRWRVGQTRAALGGPATMQCSRVHGTCALLGERVTSRSIEHEAVQVFGRASSWCAYRVSAVGARAGFRFTRHLPSRPRLVELALVEPCDSAGPRTHAVSVSETCQAPHHATGQWCSSFARVQRSWRRDTASEPTFEASERVLAPVAHTRRSALAGSRGTCVLCTARLGRRQGGRHGLAHS